MNPALPAQDLSQFENLDAVDRERWSKAAAYAFIKSQSSEVIIAVATRGLDEYIRIARPIYEGHAFRHEDYVRMFGFIVRDAEKRAQVRLT